MDFFDISHRDGKLVLIKRRAPVFIKAAAMCGFIALAFFVTWQDSFSRSSTLTWGTLVIAVLLGFFTYFGKAWRVYRGDMWTFDRNKDQLEHNGKVVGLLSGMESVQVWEDYGSDSVSHRLLLMPKHGNPIFIEEDANDRELVQLEETARRIAQFTLLRLIQCKR